MKKKLVLLLIGMMPLSFLITVFSIENVKATNNMLYFDGDSGNYRSFQDRKVNKTIDLIGENEKKNDNR